MRHTAYFGPAPAPKPADAAATAGKDANTDEVDRAAGSLRMLLNASQAVAPVAHHKTSDMRSSSASDDE